MTKTTKPAKRRARHPGGWPTPPPLEFMTLAVSFGTREQTEQAARELQQLLNDGWGLRNTAATPHADHGVLILARELKGETEHGKR